MASFTNLLPSGSTAIKPGLPLSNTKCGKIAVVLSFRFFMDIGAQKLLLSFDILRRPPTFSANNIPSP